MMQDVENTRNFINTNIRRLRDLLGLTQAQFAEKVGLSLSAIQRYEQGERVPKPKTISQISKKLGILTDALIFDPKNPRLNMIESISQTSALSQIVKNKGLTLEFVSKNTDIPVETLKLLEGFIVQPTEVLIEKILKVTSTPREEFDKLVKAEKSDYWEPEDPEDFEPDDVLRGDYIANKSIESQVQEALSKHLPEVVEAIKSAVNKPQDTKKDIQSSEKSDLITRITSLLPLLEVNNLKGIAKLVQNKVPVDGAVKKPKNT